MGNYLGCWLRLGAPLANFCSESEQKVIFYQLFFSHFLFGYNILIEMTRYLSFKLSDDYRQVIYFPSSYV
jgi:hypothetical protein